MAEEMPRRLHYLLERERTGQFLGQFVKRTGLLLAVAGLFRLPAQASG
jgi:hypothetical protein